LKTLLFSVYPYACALSIQADFIHKKFIFFPDLHIVFCKIMSYNVLCLAFARHSF
jgi:hypothetical protein